MTVGIKKESMELFLFTSRDCGFLWFYSYIYNSVPIRTCNVITAASGLNQKSDSKCKQKET